MLTVTRKGLVTLVSPMLDVRMTIDVSIILLIMITSDVVNTVCVTLTIF